MHFQDTAIVVETRDLGIKLGFALARDPCGPTNGLSLAPSRRAAKPNLLPRSGGRGEGNAAQRFP